MPIFEVEAGGRQFEIEAPDMAAATAALRRHLGGTLGKGSPAQPIAPEDGNPETWGQYAGGLARQAAQGLTFNFADEIEAGVRSLGGADYGETVEDIRRGNEAFASEHPKASIAANVAGGVLPFVAGPGAALARAAVAAPTMLGNVGRSAALGAGAGAAAGAGAGEGGAVERLDDAAAGAAFGAGAGAVAPPVAAAAGRAINRVLPGRQVQGPPAPPTAGQEAVLAGERAGVPVPRAMATDSHALQTVGGVSRGLPFGSPLEAATTRTTEALGEAAERTAAGFGAAAGPLHAGEAARQGMLDWIRGNAQQIPRRLYDAVDRSVNPSVTVPLAETRAAVLALERQMLESTGTAPQAAIDAVQQAIARPQGLSWRGAQQLRTELRDMIDAQSVPVPRPHVPALRDVYNALTIDMGRILDAAGGPRAVAAWHRADRIYERIANRRADIARIIGAEGNVAPEAVFDRIVAMAGGTSRGDFNRLMQVRRAMTPPGPRHQPGQVPPPTPWDEVASAVVQRLGRDASGDFSPARFVTAYGRLSPNGREALFGSTIRGQQGLRQALDDIATLSERFQDTISRYANPSGTGRAVTSVAGIWGAVTSPLNTIMVAGGAHVLASMLARPVTADAVRRHMQAQLQALTRPGPATTILVQQTGAQMIAAARSEGIAPDAQHGSGQ